MNTAHSIAETGSKVVVLFAVTVVVVKKKKRMDARGPFHTHVIYEATWEGAMALALLSSVLIKVDGRPQGVLRALVSAETSVGVSLERPN